MGPLLRVLPRPNFQWLKRQTIDFYKKKRQYEFIGHEKAKKGMAGDEDLLTFMRGKMARASIPRQNTQRGVPLPSCRRPADGGDDVVDSLQLHSGQSKGFQGEPFEAVPRFTICVSERFNSRGS